jgi:hypothetical protein
MVEQRQYRVAVVLPRSGQALSIRKNDSFDLLRVEVPSGTRPAAALTEGLEQTWHIRPVVIDILAGDQTRCPFAVVELRTRESQLEADLSLISIDRIDATDITGAELEFLKSILAGDLGERGPFSRFSWLDDAEEWIRASVLDHEVIFNDEVLQLNASGRFVLARLGTRNGPSYWIKATGRPNVHEFSITTTLARKYPDYLPPLVAAREDWNAWVMEDAGKPLFESCTLAALERSTARIAELQQKTIGQTAILLSNGCLDRRTSILQAHVSEMIEYLNNVMEAQTTDKVPPLNAGQLRELERVLNDSCCRIEQLGIPDTLIHNDMNPGNILIDDTRCVFTDWCEAAVGVPFLTNEYLRAHVWRQGTQAQAWDAPLKTLCKSYWLDFLDETAFDQAFVISRLLAIFAQLLGRKTWLPNASSSNTHFPGYARSLARHMDRAAHDPKLLGALYS